ncbi:MAG: hypothetical protein ALAOOOJD_00357 [bacterium]|nr:hypothetical protein [bacterium]
MVPAGQRFGHEVHERHSAFAVDDDDGIIDGSQDFCQPLLALLQLLGHPMLVERHVDGDVQLSFLERFENIAKRFGNLGALQRPVIRVSGEINNRNVIQGQNFLRRLHTVLIALEHDVHQHQIRPGFAGFLHGLFTGCDGAGNDVAEALQGIVNIFGNDIFILDDQNSGGGLEAHS